MEGLSVPCWPSHQLVCICTMFRPLLTLPEKEGFSALETRFSLSILCHLVTHTCWATVPRFAKSQTWLKQPSMCAHCILNLCPSQIYSLFPTTYFMVFWSWACSHWALHLCWISACFLKLAKWPSFPKCFLFFFLISDVSDFPYELLLHFCLFIHVNCSVMSNSLQPHGL